MSYDEFENLDDSIANPGGKTKPKKEPTSIRGGCKGICVRYKARKPPVGGRYENGQKRCQICEIFMLTDELWCPCCGYRIRSKPRNSKYKAKLRSKVGKD